jgi:hypothetical protein
MNAYLKSVQSLPLKVKTRYSRNLQVTRQCGVKFQAVAAMLQHDPEKCVAVFRKRSCSNKKIERDDD